MKKQPIYLLILLLFSCGKNLEFTEDLTIADRSSAIDCNCEMTITNPNEFIIFPSVYTYGTCITPSPLECILCAIEPSIPSLPFLLPGASATGEFGTPEKFDISGSGNIEYNQIHMSVGTDEEIDQTCIPVDIVLSCGANTISMSTVFENSFNGGEANENPAQ